ncbi:MAG: hypothetical protein ACREEX_07605 [Caulobacteraceae bacterium]
MSTCSQGSQPSRRIVKPPLTAGILLAEGFKLACRWILDPRGKLAPDRAAPAGPGVYAFSVGGRVYYVGKAESGVRGQINSYRWPGSSQPTRQRMKPLLIEQLSRGVSIDVMTQCSANPSWRGQLAGGVKELEAILIARHDLPWNVQGA